MPAESQTRENLMALGRVIIDLGSAYRDWNRQSALWRQAPSVTLSEMKSKDALAGGRRG
jgi:hypothetical protein